MTNPYRKQKQCADCSKLICDVSIRCKSCVGKSRIASLITRLRNSASKLSDKNPNWKGDEVGIKAVHIWVKRRLRAPELCQICRVKPPYDLANVTGIYNRDFENWQYLCRTCHMLSDGRMEVIHRGRKHTEEHKAKLRGKHPSEETRKKLSQAMYNRWAKNRTIVV